jgi:indole-3-glycerol phosphate synthase
MREGGDFLEELVEEAEARIRAGYYDVGGAASCARRSLKGALEREGVHIIAELKPLSPLEGRLRGRLDPVGLLRAFERGGASAISVITEPLRFGGRLDYVPLAKRLTGLPVLMKDIIIDEVQLHAASRLGADAVLLIERIFRRGLALEPLNGMISLAHKVGMEVVLEVHDERGLELALRSEADIVGINNRSLESLDVSLDVSRRLLPLARGAKPVICESGITSEGQVKELRALGARGFLIGTSLMRNSDVEAAVRRYAGR